MPRWMRYLWPCRMWYEATRITITAYQVSKDIAAYMASLEEE